MLADNFALRNEFKIIQYIHFIEMTAVKKQCLLKLSSRYRYTHLFIDNFKLHCTIYMFYCPLYITFFDI